MKPQKIYLLNMFNVECVSVCNIHTGKILNVIFWRVIDRILQIRKSYLLCDNGEKVWQLIMDSMIVETISACFMKPSEIHVLML